MGGGKNTFGLAFAALMGALALVVLYVGCMLPTGRWGLAAAAGLTPAAAVISGGFTYGALCWGGASVLAFLLLPDKLMALLFAALFGLYPLVKNLIERLRRLPVEYPLKLLFFNSSFTVIYLAMKGAVLASLPTALGVVWVLYLVGNVVFLLYDFGFSKLISLYMKRVARLGGQK